MCFISKKWRNIYITAGNNIMTKIRNKLDDWEVFVDTMGIIVPIWNKNFLVIHMSTNEMAKVDRNAFLSESESRNLSFVPFWRRFYFSSSDCECQELIKAKILTKIVISLHEVKSEWFSKIFIKSSLLWHYLYKLI